MSSTLPNRAVACSGLNGALSPSSRQKYKYPCESQWKTINIQTEKANISFQSLLKKKNKNERALKSSISNLLTKVANHLFPLLFIGRVVIFVLFSWLFFVAPSDCFDNRGRRAKQRRCFSQDTKNKKKIHYWEKTWFIIIGMCREIPWRNERNDLRHVARLVVVKGRRKKWVGHTHRTTHTWIINTNRRRLGLGLTVISKFLFFSFYTHTDEAFNAFCYFLPHCFFF